MADIPPPKPSDAEDVAWGLQTADTLWRRGERIDALVWLRRAAQAAGDANDDDRALELARFAAELTEFMNSEVPDVADDVLDEEDLIDDAGADIEVADETPLVPPPRDDSSPSIEAGMADVNASDLGEDEGEDSPRAPMPSVVDAATAHAGMFDPWAEMSSQLPVPNVAATPDPPLADEEVVTSVRPNALMNARSDAPPSRAMPISSPPPAVPPPPRASRPSFSGIAAAPTAPAPAKPPPPPLPPRAAKPALPKPSPPKPSVPRAPVAKPVEPPSEPPPPPPPPLPEPAVAVPSIPPATGLDLEAVEAFSDLPDDARAAFAAAAVLHDLNEGDEIATFALAYIVSGSFEVAATMVDAPAGRLEQGAVLRARGTTEEGVPMRLIAVRGTGVVATWSDAAVDEAFRSIPWVEDDLRAAADKIQTLVGITIGPLGERLDMSIREQVVSKLKMRTLLPAEVVVNKGETVPGLLLIGIGELELMNGDDVAGLVGSGDFLFPTEVLGMGDAPYTARAGKGGALILFGDRGVAQELLVTCPPLLEVFAGM